MKAKFKGFCPCCARTFKVRGTKLVQHGYQRPGCGFISDSCFGVHKDPHEISSATATEYLAVVQSDLTSYRVALANLPNQTKLMISDFWCGSKVVEKAERPAGGFDFKSNPDEATKLAERVREWDNAYYHHEQLLKSQITALATDVERLTKYIEDWSAQPLTPV